MYKSYKFCLFCFDRSEKQHEVEKQQMLEIITLLYEKVSISEIVILKVYLGKNAYSKYCKTCMMMQSVLQLNEWPKFTSILFLVYSAI